MRVRASTRVRMYAENRCTETQKSDTRARARIHTKPYYFFPRGSYSLRAQPIFLMCLFLPLHRGRKLKRKSARKMRLKWGASETNFAPSGRSRKAGAVKWVRRPDKSSKDNSFLTGQRYPRPPSPCFEPRTGRLSGAELPAGTHLYSDLPHLFNLMAIPHSR